MRIAVEIDWDFLAEVHLSRWARASRCRRFRCCAVHPEADPPDLAGYPDLEGHSRTSVVCAIAFSCATAQPRLCIRETLRQAANELVIGHLKNDNAENYLLYARSTSFCASYANAPACRFLT